MNISELSIRRPVLALVMTLIILIFGLIGYTYLGVREYPSVDNPIISVDCSYPGANADVIENQITEPLEQNINGIPGIRSLSSVSSQGSSRITVEFELSVDLETAANDVRDKVSRAQRFLPRDCDPPTVSKADADAMPILMIALQSDKRSLLELSEIADLTVKEQLQTISDVSSVGIWGEKRYCMRLWLDPVKMAGYGITPMDVKQAVDKENVELPSGSIEGNTTELTVRTMGLMHTAKEFNDLILRQEGNQIVRFSDVGRAELGPADIKSYMKMNGVPMVGVVVVPQPGANHIEIANAVYKRMEQMQKDLPDDVHFSYSFDNTKFIRASIDEVKNTIFEAILLVIIIIFLFLRDWRVTLVPCIVIPVSLVGSFFVMYVAGFSINVLTMLAIVLSVGLVVDDAIVMTENIYVRIERSMRPREAGIEGAKEIFFAVLSTTITLLAVFIPIVFMDGITGRLFREFSIVIAGTVCISSFAALTITPMLSTKILVRRKQQNAFYRMTEPFFVGLNRYYSIGLAAMLKSRWLVFPIIAAMVALIVWLWNDIPSEMAPMEDRSSITVRTMGTEGVTYEYLRDYTEDINLLVDSLCPDADNISARVNAGSGNIRITLKDLKDRDYSQMEVAERITQAVAKKTKARSFVQQQSSFGGRRGGMPVQYVLQATNLEKLQEILPEFMAKVAQNPTFRMSDVNLKFSKPEARLSIDRDKASILGVSTREVAQTLQYGLSGQRMGYFYMNGKQYEIKGEINRQQRNKPADLKSIYIRNKQNQMVQMDNLIDLHGGIAPPKLYRYNRFVSATISAGLADGKTIGEGLDEMDKIAAETLDDSFRTALTGDSKEFRESSSSLMFAFVLAILLIYLILAAQFESFKDPIIIMLTVPLAIAGALVFMASNSITMNIFSQIGIIMLIGLVAKNGILIVEFANQKQEAGMSKLQSIREASLQRLRPILMTSASTVLGLIPLAFATGEGCNQRIAMGIAVVGGMLVSTLMTMFVVPAIYSYISTDRSLAKADDKPSRGNGKPSSTKPADVIALVAVVAMLSPLAFVQPTLAQQPTQRSEPLRYELRDCIERGLSQNYQLQIVRNQEQMAHNNATLANAGALPTVDATASFRPTMHTSERSTLRATGEETENRNVYDYTLDAGVSLNWTLFDGFKIQTNYRQLRLLEQQGETATRLAIEDLIADITSEYYNYIQQIIRRQHYRYALALSRERLRIAELNYQTGRFSGLDYHQARVDFHSDSSAYVRQREAVHATRIRLNKLMANHDVDQRIAVPDSTISIRGDLMLEALWQQTLDANASLLNASQNTMIAEQDLRKVTSRNYPYLRLNTQYGYNYSHYDISATRERDNLGFTGGLTLGINLWDGNRRRERRNAELSIQNRKLQHQQLELDLHASLTTFWMAYRNNLDLLELQRQNLEIAESNLEIAMERYKLGNLSGFDMRQVQKALLDAEERVLQVEYDAKMCEISLLLISGGIAYYME